MMSKCLVCSKQDSVCPNGRCKECFLLDLERGREKKQIEIYHKAQLIKRKLDQVNGINVTRVISWGDLRYNNKKKGNL